MGVTDPNDRIVPLCPGGSDPICVQRLSDGTCRKWQCSDSSGSKKDDEDEWGDDGDGDTKGGGGLGGDELQACYPKFTWKQFANGTVKFQNTTVGAPVLSWHWDFGDGRESTSKNPVHTYNQVRRFEVVLRATTTGSRVYEYSEWINVTRELFYGDLAVDFEYVQSGMSFFFANTSTVAGTSWRWNFGDGSVSSQEHPKHTYTTPGTYNVVLQIGQMIREASVSAYPMISGTELPYDYQGTFGGPWGSGDGKLKNPVCMRAYDEELYVADNVNSKITVFDLTTLTFSREFGSSGTGAGQWDSIHNFCIYEDLIYVVDNTDRVQVFNLAGVYQSHFHLDASITGAHNANGTAITIWSDVIYVVVNNSWCEEDYLRYQYEVHKYDLTGAFISRFSSATVHYDTDSPGGYTGENCWYDLLSNGWTGREADHTVLPDVVMYTGGVTPWLGYDGQIEILGGIAHSGFAGNNLCMVHASWNPDGYGWAMRIADQYAVFTWQGGKSCLMLRYSYATNACYYFSPKEKKIKKKKGATVYDLYTVTMSDPTPGDNFQYYIIGNTHYVSEGGILLGSVVDTGAIGGSPIVEGNPGLLMIDGNADSCLADGYQCGAVERVAGSLVYAKDIVANADGVYICDAENRLQHFGLDGTYVATLYCFTGEDYPYANDLVGLAYMDGIVFGHCYYAGELQAYKLSDAGFSTQTLGRVPRAIAIDDNMALYVAAYCDISACYISKLTPPTLPDEYVPEIILFTAEGYTKPTGENFTLNFLFDATLPVDWTITTSDPEVDDSGTVAAEPMEGTSTISFAVAGTYTCKLVITNAYGTVEATLELVVFDPVEPEDGPDPLKLPPIAEMGANVWAGASPLTVEFEDWSYGEVESWLWEFGDGDTSADQNPTHEYTNEGVYLARLTITAGPWTSTCSHSIVVSDLDPEQWPPIIDEIYAQDNWGVAPFTTWVVGEIVGNAVSWLWDFGDGTTCTTPEEVEHTWESPGTYTVKLTVTNQFGSTSATFEIIVLYWGAIDSDLGSGYYILDTRNDRVLVYQRDGTYLKHFGRTGALGGQLNYPTGMAAFNAQKYDGKIKIQ